MKATLRFAVLALSLLAIGCSSADDASTTDPKAAMEASTQELEGSVPQNPENSTDETSGETTE